MPLPELAAADAREWKNSQKRHCRCGYGNERGNERESGYESWPEIEQEKWVPQSLPSL